MKLDAHTINKAFAYFEDQLTIALPGVLEQQYAQLWAEEGLYLPNATTIDIGVDGLDEFLYEGVGEGVELTGDYGDIPMVNITQDKQSYKVHKFALSYGYGIIDLAKQALTGQNLNTRKIRVVDHGLRQMVHNQLLFGVNRPGQVNTRGTTGLYNNPNVPVQATGYNPNTADWDAHIEFLATEITKVENRNYMASGVSFALTDKNHLHKLNTTYKDGKSARVAMEEILSSGNPDFAGIYAVNECRPDILEQFGVKNPGDNQTRMVLVPNNDLVLSYARIPQFSLEPERRELTFKVASITGVSELMIHYPQEMAYVDFPAAIL